MDGQQKLSMVAVFLACVGAMILPVADHGVGKAIFTAFILGSLAFTAVGLWRASQFAKEADEAWATLAKWREQRDRYR